MTKRHGRKRRKTLGTSRSPKKQRRIGEEEDPLDITSRRSGHDKNKKPGDPANPLHVRRLPADPLRARHFQPERQRMLPSSHEESSFEGPGKAGVLKKPSCKDSVPEDFLHVKDFTQSFFI